MKRILTIAAATSFVASSAFAAAHMPDEMTMLSGKVKDALTGCNISMQEEDAMNLTMAQVSGIVLADSSEDGGDKCNTIESIVEDNMKDSM